MSPYSNLGFKITMQEILNDTLELIRNDTFIIIQVLCEVAIQ